MRIQHNIMAMNAYRNYNTNTSALSSNLEKLSSGYKINRAGDDAAGLAISEKMRAQISGLEQASSNVKDGISLVKTGEGAMQEIQDMLNRMVTLATQSANGTYDDDTDRANLQKEVDSLKSEINRIAESANFNGISLLDGSMTEKTISDPIAATDTDVFNSIGSAAVKKLMLAESKSNDPTDPTDGVGLGTILETDATDDGGPSFTVNFDGISHTSSGTGGNGKLTLDIGGKKIELTDANMTDVEAGDTLTGSKLAQAFLKYGTDVGGTTATVYDPSTGVFNDGTDNWNVSVEGDSLKFTYANAVPAGGVNKSFAVSLAGQATSPVAATGGEQKFDITPANLGTGGTASNDNSVTVTVKTADGDVTFTTAATLAYTADESTIQPLLAAAVGKNADGTAATKEDGTALTLGDLYTITGNTTGGGITFTDKTTGVAGSGNTVTSITLNKGATTALGSGSADMKAAEDATAKKAGVDAYETGTVGYTNAATEVNIAADKPPVDQLASTTIDLTGKLTDGTKITLGDQSYIIALGANSQFKDAEGAVYLEDTSASDADIATKLTEIAKDNTTFTVGHSGTTGTITLKQLASVKGTTDMSTMDEFAKYIDVSNYDADASAKAAADAEQAEADRKAAEDAANEGKSPLTLQIGDTSETYNQLTLSIDDMHTTNLGIDDIDIGSQDGASAAIDLIKNAINKVSSTRGDLGAVQNRLEHTANNLSVMTENIQDAESTIRDTDIAEEMMSYTKNNILVQSAQAMLAQANSVPQGVLQLLQ